ncbi:MAG: tetratricopeptide repeat protein [Bacteroidota bacterium]
MHIFFSCKLGLVFLLEAALCCFCFSQSNEKIDSLHLALEATEAPASEVLLLIQLSQEVLITSQDSAFQYAQRARQKSSALQDSSLIAASLLGLSRVYVVRGQLDSASSLLNQTQAYALKQEDLGLLARTIVFQTELAIKAGRSESALKYTSLGIENLAGTEHAVALGTLHEYKGTVYRQMGDTANARLSYLESMSIRNQLNNHRAIGNTLNQLGILSSIKRQMNTSLTYFQQALSHYEKAGDVDGIIHTYGNIGKVYFEMGELGLAKPYLLKTAELMETKNDYKNLVVMFNNLGSLHGRLKRLEEAEEYYKEGLKYQAQNKDANVGVSLHKNYGFLLTERQKYNEAVIQFGLGLKLQDSIISNLQKGIALSRQLEAQKHNAELEKEKLLSQKIQMELLNRNLILGILAGIFCLIAVLVWYVARVNTKAKKRALEEHLNRMIQEQEQGMFEAMIVGQERAYSIIAKELHDNIGMLLSTTNLHFSSLEEKLGAQSVSLHEAKSTLMKALKEVRFLSKNMLSGTLHHIGFLESIKELFSIVNAIGLYQIDLQTSGLEHAEIPPSVAHSMFRCIQELVSNVIKHAEADRISLNISYEAQDLRIVFRDNGIGFSKDIGVMKEGVGLASIETRIEELKGVYQVDTSSGQGTSYVISIPLPSSQSEWLSNTP